jgi:hypothetical protein
MRRRLLLFLFLLSVPLPGLAGAPECKAVRGIEPLLKPGVVLLGEIHGTNESPAFVGEIVCHALRAGLPVTVGLEIPGEEEPRFAAYLDSAGTAADREALLAGAFWQDAYQDGRRSEAMLGLVERLRQLRKQGAKVRLVLLDVTGASSGQERDRAMAERLKAAAGGAPADLIVTLTGNIHNRTVQGTPWDASYEPMGYLVARDSALHPLSLDVSYTGGTAWTCTSAERESCQTRSLKGQGEGQALEVRLGDAVDANGFRGSYHVGTLSASPPAVSAAAGPKKPAPDSGHQPPGGGTESSAGALPGSIRNSTLSDCPKVLILGTIRAYSCVAASFQR